MNISFGIQYDKEFFNYKQKDEIAIAAEKAYNEGIIIVSSVGNRDGNKDVIYSPSYLDFIIAVGSIQNTKLSVDFQYNIAKTSSYWRTQDNKIKPNLLAPGFGIISLKSDIFYKGDVYIDDSKMAYSAYINGTSASAAVITGIVSLLLDKFPNKSIHEIENILYKNCVKINDVDYKQGAGFIYLKEDNLK